MKSLDVMNACQPIRCCTQYRHGAHPTPPAILHDDVAGFMRLMEVDEDLPITLHGVALALQNNAPYAYPSIAQRCMREGELGRGVRTDTCRT